MGKKKDKNAKKGKGAEKTAMKSEKKADRKTKKMLAEKGEDDIETLLAEIKAQDKMRSQVVEEKVPPPSPRANMTLVPHPDKDELVMFGGEFFNGSKTFMYNDLLFYNIKSGEWTKVTAPGAPPPRCAHQAVVLRQAGGQMWLFGGEFASATQSQFHHFKDLWVYHFQDKSWSKVKASGGPSARSGHRMAVYKRLILVFGGFHDNLREYKYFNDVHAFNTDTQQWTKLEPSGNAPSPRSGCPLVASQDNTRLICYGGYCKEKVKKDVDVGHTFSDMFCLIPDGKHKEEAVPSKWMWQSLKQTGARPPPRCSFTVVSTPGNRALLFGGVFDEQEDDETVEGVFFNDMYSLELDKAKWHDVQLRGKRDGVEKRMRRRRKQKDGGDGEESEEEEGEEVEHDLKRLKVEEGQGDTICDAPTTTYDDGIFTVTVGPQSTDNQSSSAEMSSSGQDLFRPCERMNPQLAVKHGILYMYGGLLEQGDKQITLADMYALDLHKLDEWKTLIEFKIESMEWEGSDSEDDDGDDEEDEDDEVDGAVGGKDDSEDSDDDEDMDVEVPEVRQSETPLDYFSRTRDYWMQKADDEASQDGASVTGKQLKKLAFSMAEEHINKMK